MGLRRTKVTDADRDTTQCDSHFEESATGKQLVFFFLLTFLFSWGWWGLWKALHMSVPLFLVGTAGPTVAAFVVLGVTSRGLGVMRFLSSYVRWQVGVRWYLLTLFSIPILLLLSYAAVPGALANFHAPDWSLITLYGSSLTHTLFIPPSGPLLEEGGWRGFSLRPLQRILGPLAGTLVLGALWGLWHAPFYFGPLALTGPDTTMLDTGTTFAEYLVGIIGVSVVMSWIFNNTQGSVLIAVLLHAGFDAAWTFSPLFPSVDVGIVPVSLTLGIAMAFGAAASVIVIATRGNLGYQRLSDRPVG